MQDDDNFFDDDDAVDFILYEEMTRQGQDNQSNQKKPGNNGCLGVVVLLVLPALGIGYLILNIG